MRDPEEPKSEEQSRGDGEAKKPLSAEEQMEQFETDLKENDWGHQPC